MGNDVMTKKTKRMESQTTLSIRECEMEEETDDKMFVRFIQETISQNLISVTLTLMFFMYGCESLTIEKAKH